MDSINEANQVRCDIEKNFQTIEMKNNQNKGFYNDFDNNDDALMISEANEEIFDSSMIATTTNIEIDGNNNIINKNSELLKIEEAMNETLSLNTIDLKLNQFLNQKFIKCKADNADVCYGHFGYDVVLGRTCF